MQRGHQDRELWALPQVLPIPLHSPSLSYTHVTPLSVHMLGAEGVGERPEGNWGPPHTPNTPSLTLLGAVRVSLPQQCSLSGISCTTPPPQPMTGRGPLRPAGDSWAPKALGSQEGPAQKTRLNPFSPGLAVLLRGHLSPWQVNLTSDMAGGGGRGWAHGHALHLGLIEDGGIWRALGVAACRARKAGSSRGPTHTQSPTHIDANSAHRMGEGPPTLWETLPTLQESPPTRSQDQKHMAEKTQPTSGEPSLVPQGKPRPHLEALPTVPETYAPCPYPVHMATWPHQGNHAHHYGSYAHTPGCHRPQKGSHTHCFLEAISNISNISKGCSPSRPGRS